MPRGDGAQVWDRQGTTFIVPGAPVSLSITICSLRIARVRIGEADVRPASPYITEREWPGAVVTEQPGPPPSIDAGELVLRLTTDPWCVLLADRLGRSRLRLPLAEVECVQSLHIRLELVDAQHFYGLGEGGQQFDRFGVTRRFWNNHVHHGQGADIPIPLLVSHLGYGLFFDDAGPADLTVGGADGGRWVDYRGKRGPLDLYYLIGDSLREVLGEVSTLLGQAPLPPRWALGYLQSTRHFDNADEWRRVVALIREKRLPCDGLIFLSTYGDELGWNRGVGHLECEPRILPDPPRMFGELRAQRFHAITHEYPVLHPDSPLHPEACERGYLLDAGYPRVTPAARPSDNYREGQRYLDFSRPEVREWWWREHRALADLGIRGGGLTEERARSRIHSCTPARARACITGMI